MNAAQASKIYCLLCLKISLKNFPIQTDETHLKQRTLSLISRTSHKNHSKIAAPYAICSFIIHPPYEKEKSHVFLKFCFLALTAK